MLKQDAVKHFQGKSRLAAALKITPAAVSQWGEQVPMRRQYELQIITKGLLRASHVEFGDSMAA